MRGRGVGVGVLAQEKTRIQALFEMMSLAPRVGSTRLSLHLYVVALEKSGTPKPRVLAAQLQKQLLGIFWDKTLRVKEVERMRLVVSANPSSTPGPVIPYSYKINYNSIHLIYLCMPYSLVTTQYSYRVTGR